MKHLRVRQRRKESGGFKVQFLDIRRANQNLEEVTSKWIAQHLQKDGDPFLSESVFFFESLLEKKFGVGTALSVSSGTAALTIALRMRKLPEGSEVAVPGFTFISSASCILENRCIPYFMDIDPETGLVTEEEIERVLNRSSVKALIIPHLYGQMVQLENVFYQTRKKDIWLIEDAAQAVGSHCFGNPPGTWSDACCLSFDPQKIIGAWGSGGALLLRDPEHRAVAAQLRNYGFRGDGFFDWCGLNAKMDGFQAFILSNKMERLGSAVASRQAIWETYQNKILSLKKLKAMRKLERRELNGARFIFRTLEQKRVREFFTHQGIETKIHYPFPVYHQIPFRSYQAVPLKGCEELARTNVSLPIFPEMNREEIHQVVSALEEIETFLD